MKSERLKKELHHAIDVVNDNDILYAVYTILKKNTDELSDEQKKELDKRLDQHKKGKVKYYTLAEVKKSVKKALKK